MRLRRAEVCRGGRRFGGPGCRLSHNVRFWVLDLARSGQRSIPTFTTTRECRAHNMAIGLLVEEGIVGLVLFAGIFGACAWTIFRSPPPHGALWGVLLLTWLVGGMSGNPETVKFTWVLFGLVAAQSGLANTATGLVRQRHQYRSGNNATGAMPRAPSAAGVVPQAARIQ